MKCLILILQLGICTASFAQMSAGLKKYYFFINKAELAIVDHKYAESSNYFDSAFAIYQNGFAKDFYNASLCAAIEQNDIKCYKYLRNVLKRGYDLNIVKTIDYFDSFWKSELGKNLISEYYQKSFFLIDTLLRKKLLELEYRDQFYRRQDNGYVLYSDSIKRSDKLNVEEFNQILLQYGFPDENLAGVNDGNFKMHPYDVIIIHQSAGNPNQIYSYCSVVQEAVEKGKLEVHRGAYLLVRSCGDDRYGYFGAGLIMYTYDISTVNTETFNGIIDTVIKSKWGVVPLADIVRSEINAKRLELGLESIDDYRKKLLFQFSNTIFQFGLMGGSSNYYFSKYLEYESAVKNLIFVE